MKNLSKKLERESAKIVKGLAGKTYEDAMDILSCALCDILDSALKNPESKVKFGMLVAEDIIATLSIYASADEMDEPYEQTLARLKHAYGTIWRNGRYLKPVA